MNGVSDEGKEWRRGFVASPWSTGLRNEHNDLIEEE